MIHSVKDLSPDQKLAIESLLGRPVSEGEQVSVRTVPASPEWLTSIQQDARKKGTDKLTMEEIDAEIAASSAAGADFSVTPSGNEAQHILI